MRRRQGLQAWALMAFIGLGASCGETPADILLDALCNSDDDCANSQTCVKTEYQQIAGGQGWCRESAGDCAVGEQPGCACRQEGVSYFCMSTTEPVTADSEAPGCRCSFACDVNDDCPGGLVPDTGPDGTEPCVCVVGD